MYYLGLAFYLNKFRVVVQINKHCVRRALVCSGNRRNLVLRIGFSREINAGNLVGKKSIVVPRQSFAAEHLVVHYDVHRPVLVGEFIAVIGVEIVEFVVYCLQQVPEQRSILSFVAVAHGFVGYVIIYVAVAAREVLSAHPVLAPAAGVVAAFAFHHCAGQTYVAFRDCIVPRKINAVGALRLVGIC